MSLDISAAFDTIDHDILLDRLRTEFNVRDTALAWIHSYITSRYAFVKVGQATSASCLCKFGVAQGSVLGSLLFTVYISPVGRVINSYSDVRYHKYADDTQVYIELKDNSSMASLSECISHVQYWFLTNKLQLNSDKSDAIVYGTVQRHARVASPKSMSVAGADILTGVKIKSLGVTLDRCLNYYCHVQNVVQSCNFHMSGLRHIRNVLSHEIANTIASSLIASRLDYCNSLLYGISASNIDKLQRVQNNLARIVCCVKDRSVGASTLLHQLHWLPVGRRIQFKLASLCYRILHTGQPNYLASMLTWYEPVRQLRSSATGLLVVPPHIIDIAARRFSCAAPRIWNSIPSSVRTASSLRSFKTALKTHLFTTQQYYL